jgi:hypothetical protein
MVAESRFQELRFHRAADGSLHYPPILAAPILASQPQSSCVGAWWRRFDRYCTQTDNRKGVFETLRQLPDNK